MGGVGSPSAINGEFVYQTCQEREFSLVFEDGVRMKYLLVGASVYPGAPPKTDYEFQILPSEFAKHFTITTEAMAGKEDRIVKGSVVPGKPAIEIRFKYNPPQETSLTCGDVTLDLLGGIGQWITCKVKGTLTGGYVPPPDAPNSSQEISVELKAYLQQI